MQLYIAFVQLYVASVDVVDYCTMQESCDAGGQLQVERSQGQFVSVKKTQADW